MNQPSGFMILATIGFLMFSFWPRPPGLVRDSVTNSMSGWSGGGNRNRASIRTTPNLNEVPTSDRRLKNKTEVLALTFPEITEDTMAISVKFLKKNVLYSTQLGEQQLVVLTDQSGASRVYEAVGHEFVQYDRDSSLTDSAGNVWDLTEDQLTWNDQTLDRLPTHRAFWFGWHAAYPDTNLIK